MGLTFFKSKISWAKSSIEYISWWGGGDIKPTPGVENLTSAITQSALFSNRPSYLKIIQTSDDLTYEASATIESITYGGKSPSQQNAIKLNGF